jgi:hypothetical protein
VSLRKNKDKEINASYLSTVSETDKNSSLSETDKNSSLCFGGEDANKNGKTNSEFMYRPFSFRTEMYTVTKARSW